MFNQLKLLMEDRDRDMEAIKEVLLGKEKRKPQPFFFFLYLFKSSWSNNQSPELKSQAQRLTKIQVRIAFV